MNDKNVFFQLDTEKTLIRQDVPSQRVLAISLRAPQSNSTQRTPLNLALVLDRSGSMSGDKISYVKQAASHVLDLLNEQDKAVVVTYDDEINQLAPLSNITPANRQELKHRISGIRPGGNTNLSGGWLNGCEALALAQGGNAINRTLLLTDGLANEGITDLEKLSSHAREIFRRGVSTSTFGVGLGFNEHLLEAMSNMGGGSFYYIENPSEIPALFQREFKELATVTASNLVIELHFPPTVSMEALGGWACEASAGQIKLTPGNLFSGQDLEIYLKVLTPPGNATEGLTIRATLCLQDETGQKLSASSEITFLYTQPDEVEAAPVKKEIMERFAAVDLAATAAEALKLERAGNHKGASQMMRQSVAEHRLYSRPSASHEYERLADDMIQGMDESTLKDAHYAAYLKKRMRDDKDNK